MSNINRLVYESLLMQEAGVIEDLTNQPRELNKAAETTGRTAALYDTKLKDNPKFGTTEKERTDYLANKGLTPERLTNKAPTPDSPAPIGTRVVGDVQAKSYNQGYAAQSADSTQQ